MNINVALGALAIATTVGVSVAGDHCDPEAALFQNVTWAIVRTTNEVDPAVLAALRSRFGSDPRLSSPSEPFEATDVVSGKPSRRLVLAGHAQARWFVAYERGESGHHLVLVVFDCRDAAPTPVLLARGSAGKHDGVRGWQVGLADLRHALKSGDLARDDPNDQYYQSGTG